MTLEAVAGEAGFNSLSTFYRVFSKIYSCTPSEYRERMNRWSGDFDVVYVIYVTYVIDGIDGIDGIDVIDGYKARISIRPIFL